MQQLGCHYRQLRRGCFKLTAQLSGFFVKHFTGVHIWRESVLDEARLLLTPLCGANEGHMHVSSFLLPDFDTLAMLPWATKRVYKVFQKGKDLREQQDPSPVEESSFIPPKPPARLHKPC